MGAIAASLDGKPLSHWGDKVQRATLLGPTIFPIMFAALVGSTLKALARFRAENGARLEVCQSLPGSSFTSKANTWQVLEQLMGSHTLFSTLETHFFLHSFGPLGVGLVLLWALSPLGGQSSLRLLDTTQHPLISSAELQYLSSNQSTSFTHTKFLYTAGIAINPIYTASLLAPESTRLSSMDTWGNVKIPIYEKLANRPASGNPWLPVTGNATYSSLLGLPLVRRPDSYSLNFTVESTYFNLECQSLKYVKRSDVNTTVTNTQLHQAGNYSALFTEAVFLDTTTPFPDVTLLPTDASQPRNILFGSKVGDDTGMSLAKCTIASTRVESHVQCQQSRCSVDRMRLSENDRRAATSTPFDSPIVCPVMFRAFATAAGNSPVGAATVTEQFIHNPDVPYSLVSLELYKVPKDVFTERLALLINTYYQAGLAPSYQTGARPTTMSDFDLAYSNTAFISGHYNNSSPIQTNITIASVTDYERVFVCNRSWLVITMICSLILQICAIAGLVLKHRLTGPDVMGLVSSLTRDNPYTPLPPGGSTLDGLDLTRLLRNVRVRLEDVKWSEDVGHIALTFTAGGPGSASRLRKNRPYL